MALEVRATTEFSTWIDALRDVAGRAKLLVQVERLAAGNPGRVTPVGNGVSELRINFGPGYRVYFCPKRTTIIVLLVGGDKSTQAADIRRAHKTCRRSCELTMTR